MTDLANQIEIARLAVTRACVVCRGVQADLDRVRAIAKDDRSPVTVADLASQAIIAKTMRDELGEHFRLVAEESAEELRKARTQWDGAIEEVLRALAPVWPDATAGDMMDAIDMGNDDPINDGLHTFWTLDPIDGTKGFLRGGQYAVSLAKIENARPTIGLLGCPNLSRDMSRPFDEPDAHGSLYIATLGDGLYESPADELDAEPLRVRRLEHDEGDPITMCESVEAAHTSHGDSARIIESLGGAGEPARLDSQAKYAVVARGQADLYLRLPKKAGYVERIWDHAAGALVAEEAGCAVTDVDGKPLDFGHGQGLEKNRGIVVGPPRLHGRVMGAMEQLGLRAPSERR